MDVNHDTVNLHEKHLRNCLWIKCFLKIQQTNHLKNQCKVKYSIITEKDIEGNSHNSSQYNVSTAGVAH